ncbi:hypothetical protein GCM10010910_05610 [Microbacterium nanhaiense]|uniref:DUF2207 domain-containing protein n=1 Tax=Microbacterium nanhaiense TaxID=1301026 RepID=A0ABQ2MZ40_9MICO|nr:DUF2207 domain-containing protein [Microbacterium nanhaiense]GGO60362.1 hypothetical protein GCM10010910_05610 [Microbacterium nanhaiense]
MSTPERIPAPAPPRHTPLYGWLAGRMARWERGDEAASRRSIGAVWSTCVLLLIGCAVLLFGPIVNAPTSLDDVLDTTRDAAHDRWIARETSVEMSLELGDDGRLRAQVVESFTAFFPDDIDESGIERTVLAELEGHDLNPRLSSATLDGEAIEPDERRSATRTSWVLDAGERLSGDHEFSLAYSLDDLAYDTEDPSSGRRIQTIYWDAFGPEFEQGSAKTAFSITMPRELSDALVSGPRGAVYWTIIGSSAVLEPESVGPGLVRYSVTNDQNLPPYASMTIEADFDEGTFSMPTPTVLFWLMLLGPFLPLALCAVLLTSALAARAALWSDAEGDPWIVARFTPPKGVSPSVAARVMRARRTVRLVDFVARYQGEPSARHERQLAREARLAASPGLAIARPSGYRSSKAWREQFEQKLRRRPRGLVTHVLLAAAVVLVGAQFALTRQLAGHERIGLEWWPVAATGLLIVLAVITASVVLTAAPLTPRGAKLRDAVEGIRLYDRGANLGELVDIHDRLLPYALMTRTPRESARTIQRVLADARIEPDRTPRGLPALRASVRVVPVLAVAAAIVFVSVFPGPTSDAPGSASYELDRPGRYGVSVQRFDAEAGIAGGSADPRIEVTETLDVTVLDAGRTPQLFRDWHDRVDGHDTRLSVTEVRVDGSPVPFEQERVSAPRVQADHAMMQTRIEAPWPGTHTVEIDYVVASPVATVRTADGWQQRIRWAALAPGWDWDWDDYDTPLESASASLRVPEELASLAAEAPTGWEIDRRDREDREAEVTRAGDVTTMRFAGPGEYGLDTEYDDSDAGIQLVFDEGTFAQAGTRAEWRAMRIAEARPVWIQYVFALPAFAAGIIGVLRRPRRGTAREAVSFVSIGFTIASIVTWFWGSVNAYGEEPWFAVPGIIMLANIALAITASVLMWRTGPSPAPRTG